MLLSRHNRTDATTTDATTTCYKPLSILRTACPAGGRTATSAGAPTESDDGERTVDSNDAPRMRKTSSQVDYYSQDTVDTTHICSTSRLWRRDEP